MEMRMRKTAAKAMASSADVDRGGGASMRKSMDGDTGWLPDPFGRHESRYFHQGKPTNRVRDGSSFSFEAAASKEPAARNGTVDPPIVTADATNGAAAESTNGAVAESANGAAAPPPPPPPPTTPTAPAASDVSQPAEPGAEVGAGAAPLNVPGGEPDPWSRMMQATMARAQALNTPETWAEAASAAAAVSEMARVMAITTEAQTTAEELGEAAASATEAANEAVQEAESSARAADEAAQVAQIAADAATAARTNAERAARAAPEATRRAEAVVESAATASRRARDLEETLQRARTINTPAAWTEALAQATGQAIPGVEQAKAPAAVRG
jgi:colicin import membrane protein